MDPYSIYLGAKYGYKGTKAVLEWLANLKSGNTDLEELKDVLKALGEDNQRLIELTQQQGEEINLLRRQLGAIFVLCLLLLIAIIGLAVRH